MTDEFLARRCARISPARKCPAPSSGADLRRGAVIKRGAAAPTGREFDLPQRTHVRHNLSECKLLDADFGRVDSGASLQGADLRGASFAGAELKGVELKGANRRCSFRRAVMDETTAARGDLMRATRPALRPAPSA